MEQPTDVKVFSPQLHTNKSIFELMNELLAQRTEEGDEVLIYVLWRGVRIRPRLFLKFTILNPQRQKNAGWVELTDYLPEEPNKTNPVSGSWEGFSSWQDVITNSTRGIGTRIEGMIKRAGRRVRIREEKGQG
jgi:hypothetical protein